MFRRSPKIFFVFLGLTAAVLGFDACGTAHDKTYVVVCFDVEDYITPAEEGIDEIPKWLAEIMSEEGVPGTFFVIGEKARSLEERGRADVIAAMAQHDIASHTDLGSIHPTVTEILEDAAWEEGLRTMLKQEQRGFRELERIFGRHGNTLGRHGGSYGPQLVAALAEMGAGFVYSPVHLPGHNAVWFCNALNFHGSYGGFDDTYYRDDLFEPRFAELQDRFPADIAGLDVLAFFAAHPCKIRTTQFWDINYYRGANPGPEDWKMPELRPAASMQTAQKNFRSLMQYLKGRDDIELTTFADLMQRYSFQRPDISRRELGRIVEKIREENRIVIDAYYSAGEIFDGVVEYLAQYKESGELPGAVDRFSPFGPLQMPPVQPEIDEITLGQALSLAQEADIYLHEHNHLPARLAVEGGIIGTGSMLALFCEVFAALSTGNPPDRFPVISFEAYPHDNEEPIIRSVEGSKGWPVHRDDLDMSHLAEMTRLQLWTLKPASIR